MKNVFKLNASMIEGSIWKSIILFSVPILIGTLIQQFYNTADSIIVGRFVSSEALAAVGASSAITSGITYFFQGFTNGSTVLISRFYGAKAEQEVKQSVDTSILIGIISGLVLTILFLPITHLLLVLTLTPQEILGMSNIYFQIVVTGFIAMALYNTGTAILRAIGDSVRPLIYLVIASLLNIVLDLIFVCIFQMGVAGAAIATIISQYVSAILVIIRLITVKDVYSIHLLKLKFNSVLCSDIIRIGIPSGIRNGMVSFACILLQSQVNSFGTLATAGYTAGSRIVDFMYMPGGAFSMAATTFTSQNIGAGQYERIKQCSRVCIILNTLFTFGFALIAYLGQVPIISLFTSDPQVYTYASWMLLIVGLPSFLWGIQEVYAGFITGSGNSFTPMVIVMVNLCIIRLLWIYIMLIFIRDIRIVYSGFPVSWISGCICMICYYVKKPWLEKAIQSRG